MSLLKAFLFLKYVGAVLVFFIIYILCSAIAYWFIWFQNRGDMNILILPYLISPVAGILGVWGALHIVEKLFHDIRPRIVAWVFAGFAGIVVGPLLLGLFLGVVGVTDAPLESHVLLRNPDERPRILQLTTAAVAAWYMTRRKRA